MGITWSLVSTRETHLQQPTGRRSSFLNHSRGQHQGLRECPRFFAFDSFSGLPEGPAARYADYAPGAYSCTQNQFTQNIVELGVRLNDVVVVPGFYDKTLTSQTKELHRLQQAAIIMIDCDLYESTLPVLEFVTDRVGQGTILIFHDWFRFRGSPKCGEQRACREWLERNPHLELIEFWREGPQAVSFLVNLRLNRTITSNSDEPSDSTQSTHCRDGHLLLSGDERDRNGRRRLR
jgi:macrocin-O-methyltransferase TylF-like protien